MRDKIWFMVFILGVIASVFGGSLAFVNAHTSEVLEERTFKETILPTLNTVFEPYKPTNDFLKDKEQQHIGEDPMGRQLYADIYYAKRGAEVVAMATVVDGRGFGGVFTILVAADAKTHEIIATQTLQQKETKSLGGRIANDDEPFVQQFKGMRIESNLSLKSVGGDVDGMTGATITSGAFAKAVKTAGELFISKNK